MLKSLERALIQVLSGPSKAIVVVFLESLSVVYRSHSKRIMVRVAALWPSGLEACLPLAVSDDRPKLGTLRNTQDNQMRFLSCHPW
jgi:hypothetical protein